MAAVYRFDVTRWDGCTHSRISLEYVKVIVNYLLDVSDAGL